MTTITASDLKTNHSEVLGRVRFSHERIAITYHGKEVAVIVPLEDARLLEKIEMALDASDALDALNEAESKGTISLADLKAELGR